MANHQSEKLTPWSSLHIDVVKHTPNYNSNPSVSRPGPKPAEQQNDYQKGAPTKCKLDKNWTDHPNHFDNWAAIHDMEHRRFETFQSPPLLHDWRIPLGSGRRHLVPTGPYFMPRMVCLHRASVRRCELPWQFSGRFTRPPTRLFRHRMLQQHATAAACAHPRDTHVRPLSRNKKGAN